MYTPFVCVCVCVSVCVRARRIIHPTCTMREEHAHNGGRVYTQIPRFEITMVGNSNRHTTWRHFRTCIDRQRFFRECVARDTSERRVVQERLKQEGRREDFLELDAELASERLEDAG